MDFWQQVYHLSGLTLLDMTKEEALGSLPLPLRTAALAVAERELFGSLHVEWEGDPTYGAAGRYAHHWHWRTAAPPAALAQAPPPPTLHDYFARHNLLPQAGKQDEHFAERLFVERVFVPLFGLPALARLQPQVTFTDTTGKRRAIDFVLDNGEGKRYALEIEGRTYHQELGGSSRFEKEKFRQRALVLADYLYHPIAYSEIEQGDALQAREALLRLIETNETLHRFLNAQQHCGDSLTAVQKATLHLIFEVLPVRFPFYQAHALDLLREASARKQTALEIWERPEDGPLLLLALFDALALVEHVAKLYAIDLFLPPITFHRSTADPLYTALVSEYLHADLIDCGEQPDHRRDKALAHVRIQASSAGENRQACALDCVSTALNTLRRRFGPDFPSAASPRVSNLQTLEPLLDYFARRYFPLSELKFEQKQLLHRALAGQSGIGILPTGFGKSLVFQLYALLTPGTTLVISPLKSLIHDQLASMRRIGLSCVHAITSNDTASVKQWTLQQLAAHRIRLLYVSPERLRIKSFYDELFPSGRVTPVCSLFIDEVHCISEWGHDFRPAYLAIGDLVRKLSEARGSHVPVTGLTATASRDVRADILEVLLLAAEDVVQQSSSDRSNLSLSVHPASEGAHTKTGLITHLLRTTLPQTLGIPSADLIAYPQTEGKQYSGVVFGMYANAHGKTMVDEGVHQIAQELRTVLGLPDAAIGVHASAPSRCPHCGSATYRSQPPKTAGNSKAPDTDTEYGNWCPSCQKIFNRPVVTHKDIWQQQLENTQDGFYRSEFPLMVATKGYGMGIDKRNIRFIIHHAIAGGMESYYQEAGRAGRDGKPAHVALICKLPVRRCYEDHLLREAAPPCVTDEECARFRKCPYSSSGVCDAGRQAWFIAQSYPGIEQDTQGIVDVYKKLRDLKGADLQIRQAAGEDGESGKEKQTDLALYRLQQLGLLLNYTKEYQGNGYIRYRVEKAATWTAQSVAVQLTRFLARSGLSAEAIDAALQPLRVTDLWLTEEKGREARYTFLAAAASVLLQRIYDRVLRMRYTMLSSLLRYAFNDQGRCRRLYIRTYFDDQPPDDNYRCEFCDACQPDLQFIRREAVIPEADWQLEHISKQLPNILATFHPSRLQQVVTMAETRLAVVSLFEKISRVLEDDATNLAALYLTGALARRQQGLAGLALERLRFAFAEGERQGLDQAQLRLIVEEAQAIDTAAALRLIDRRRGAFDDAAGLAFVEQTAANLHGSTSPQPRAVRSLRRVRGYRTLHADMAAVSERLQELHAALSPLPSAD